MLIATLFYYYNIHIKGAELFAKRRKRSEKWIVDETTRSANNPAVTSYSAGPTQIYDTNQTNYIDQVCVHFVFISIRIAHS